MTAQKCRHTHSLPVAPLLSVQISEVTGLNIHWTFNLVLMLVLAWTFCICMMWTPVLIGLFLSRGKRSVFCQGVISLRCSLYYSADLSVYLSVSTLALRSYTLLHYDEHASRPQSITHAPVSHLGNSGLYGIFHQQHWLNDPVALTYKTGTWCVIFCSVRGYLTL